MVERLGPIDAFRRSQHLVAGNGWPVFGVLVVALLIEFGIGIGLSTIAKSLSASDVSYWISSIVSSTITAPIFALAVSVLYFELSGSPSQPKT